LGWRGDRHVGLRDPEQGRALAHSGADAVILLFGSLVFFGQIICAVWFIASEPPTLSLPGASLRQETVAGAYGRIASSENIP